MYVLCLFVFYVFLSVVVPSCETVPALVFLFLTCVRTKTCLHCRPYWAVSLVVERPAYTGRVGGSIPSLPIVLSWSVCFFAGLAQW